MKYTLNKTGEIITLPLHDYFSGLKACLADFKVSYLIVIVIAFFASWWIYVPVHELFHAFGCMLGGGEVGTLNLSPIYGASFLKRFFPFISVGSEYAGQLTDFDTHNSYLTYLLTVFFPYLLTILIGIPLLKSVANNSTSPWINCIKFGAALPIAFAPFISITGDYYEMGSIIVSRFASFLFSSFQVERWQSDDLFKLSKELFFSNDVVRIGDIGGVILSFLLGIILAFVTYWIGRLWAKVIIK
ncbi:MAG: hypothetical protein HZC48_13840 [Nitrospirae bacterium]|nr:hypothetical protein [Nitrospirota bacterium]